MSDTPFEAPEEQAETGRPTGVTVVAVLALLLGVAGLLGVLTSCVSLGVNLFAPNLLAGGLESQAAAQQALMEKGRPLMGVSIGLVFAIVPLSLLLTLGGAMVLGGLGRGVRWLKWAFAYGLVLEPLRFLLQLVSQIYLYDETVAVATATPSGLGGDTASLIVAISVGAGVAFGGLWMLAKVLFYALGARALNREGALDWQAGLR